MTDGVMEYEGRVRFGDRVRVCDTDAARHLGLVGLMGMVDGETTPSVTGVDVIGRPAGDFALNVELDGGAGNFWFAADCLEFVDHAPGTVVRVGDRAVVRRPDGSWQEEVVDDPRAKRRRWWWFW